MYGEAACGQVSKCHDAMTLLKLITLLMNVVVWCCVLLPQFNRNIVRLRGVGATDLTDLVSMRESMFVVQVGVWVWRGGGEWVKW